MLKKRFTLGVAMALLMPLAACAGGTDPETSGGAEAPSGEPLQFYLSGDTSQGADIFRWRFGPRGAARASPV